MLSRWSDFRIACPARPKYATPSCASAGCGPYLTMNRSASGCPEPITGNAPSGADRAISSPSSFVSEIAFCRYFSEISSEGTATTAGPRASRSADSLLGLRRPLERLEVEEGARAAHDLRAAEAEHELLGPIECPHPQHAGPHALEHVGVRARAHLQAVFAREAQRLLVVRLEQQARVVDLEHVDLRQVALDRRGIGNGVDAVEGVGEVDDPALLADRGDGVVERQPAWDLLLEEEPDHLALRVGLDFLARDHDQLAAACLLDRLERAAEDVVVGDRDRAEAGLLRVVEQFADRDLAVVRPARVQV